MKPALIVFLFTWPALAGEYAVLSSGARLYADRHESDGSKVRLYTTDGSTEMDAGVVIRFEQEDFKPPEETAAAAPSEAAPEKLAELVDNAARKYGLPPSFVRAVVAAES